MTLTLIDHSGTRHRVEVQRDGRLLGTIHWREWSDRRGFEFRPAGRLARPRSRILCATLRQALIRMVRVPDAIALAAITRMGTGRS